MTIKYTTLAGKEFEISQEFRQFGIAALWNASLEANALGSHSRGDLIDEAHRIISAVLYGTINKED